MRGGGRNRRTISTARSWGDTVCEEAQKRSRGDAEITVHVDVLVESFTLRSHFVVGGCRAHQHQRYLILAYLTTHARFLEHMSCIKCEVRARSSGGDTGEYWNGRDPTRQSSSENSIPHTPIAILLLFEPFRLFRQECDECTG